MASASAQKALCKRVCSIVGQMAGASAAVASVAGVQSPRDSLTSYIPTLKLLSRQLLSAAHSCNSQQKAAHVSVQAVYGVFVKELTTLLTVLLPQLRNVSSRLDIRSACSKTSAEEDLFLELWMFMFAGCSAFSSISGLCLGLRHIDQLPLHLPLFTAFTAILEWLLSLSRSTVWLSMQKRLGLEKRSHELLMILSQPADFLCNIVSFADLDDMVSSLSLLPNNMLPLLCCIASEQLSSIPFMLKQAPSPSPGQPVSFQAKHILGFPPGPSGVDILTRSLIMGIYNFIAVEPSCRGHSQVFHFLQAPALRHFLKTVITLSGPLHLANSCLLAAVESLHQLIRARLHDTPLSACTCKVLRDASGLPLHLDPLTDTAVLQTDARLLHALSTRLPNCGVPQELCLAVKDVMLQSWMFAAQLCVKPCAALYVMKDNVVGQAKQCAQYGIALMQRLQAGQITKPRQQQKLLQQSTPAGTELVAFNSIHAAGMRNLMSLSTMFCTLKDTIAPNADSPVVDHLDKSRGMEGVKRSTLYIWWTMLGWGTINEALHRGEHGLKYLNAIPQFVQSISPGPSLSGCNDSDILMLRGKISLAATLRKLVWPYVQRGGSYAVPGRQGLQLSRHSNLQQWTDEQRRVFHLSQLDILAPHLACAAAGVEHTLAVYASSNILTDASNSAQQSSSNAGKSDLVDDEESMDGVRHVLGRNVLVSDLLQQLYAINLLTLLQVCVWRMECDQAAPRKTEPSVWWPAIGEVFRAVQDKDLRAVQMFHFEACAPKASRPQPKIDAVWEQYAVTHLNGRLVPGCCHLGCTNLEGVSEAALQTQLCSGCKRARYCSVKCQRAAWREGGHSTVCGS